MKTFKDKLNGIQKAKEQIQERDQLEEARGTMTREELEAQKYRRKEYGYDDKPITSEEKHSDPMSDTVGHQADLAVFKKNLKFKQ
jgi:hypothetical protein